MCIGKISLSAFLAVCYLKMFEKSPTNVKTFSRSAKEKRKKPEISDYREITIG